MELYRKMSIGDEILTKHIVLVTFLIKRFYLCIK